MSRRGVFLRCSPLCQPSKMKAGPCRSPVEYPRMIRLAPHYYDVQWVANGPQNVALQREMGAPTPLNVIWPSYGVVLDSNTKQGKDSADTTVYCAHLTKQFCAALPAPTHCVLSVRHAVRLDLSSRGRLIAQLSDIGGGTNNISTLALSRIHWGH